MHNKLITFPKVQDRQFLLGRKLRKVANKWGLELRCYFNDRNGFPGGVQITSNRAYRPEYSYRFNDVDVIWDLFNLGYRIGIN